MDAQDAQGLVSEAYWKILGRAPDAGGLKGLTQQMLTGKLTKEGLEEKLLTSPEYKRNLTDPVLGDKNGTPLDFYPFHVERSGYGILAKNIAKYLSENGYRININRTGAARIGLHVTMPSYFRKTNAINIGYTMFEASRIPDSWVRPCNLMDILLVPLESNVGIFRSCGVKIPIYVVPIGIDTKVFNPNTTADSNLVMGAAFKFLVINDGQARKNNGMIIEAFQEEFGKEIAHNQVKLVFRTNMKYEGNGIVWIDSFLNDSALAALIKSCNCMINASSGEAGDIPILAGMAMAKPVIVSKELAHSEYVEDNVNGFFIVGNVEPAFTQPVYAGMKDLHDATWVMPAKQSLKEKMRYVYENRAVAQQVGRTAREYVLKNRTNEICLKKMRNIFAKSGFEIRCLNQINVQVSKNPITGVTICELANSRKWNDRDWLRIQDDLKGPAYQPPTFIHRKGWEWVQCIYGLEKLGVLTETAIGLGVGVGHEPLIHYFSNRVGQVIATDLYDENSDWAKRNAKEGDPSILNDLDKFAPFPYRKDRVEVKRMNGCDLKFADNTFDFVWSCSSIEHFGSPENAAVAMREIERVLKPGGIAAIATEFIIQGPQIYNVPNLTLFGAEGLYKYIISSHRLKPVQPIDFSVDDHCMRNCIEFPSEIGAPHTIKKPHMVLRFKNMLFTSIFLFFRKE